MDECVVCEIKTGRKRLYLTVLYRSPSQTPELVLLFKQNWEEPIVNNNNCSPSLYLIIGEFNARNSDGLGDDITNPQGSDIESDIEDLASQNDLHQIIDELTHILPNYASCRNLLFSSATGFIADSGVPPFLFHKCHHQLIFAKVDFKIFFPLPMNDVFGIFRGLMSMQ